jgi:xylan 1,4-beta-xylosidase
MFGQMEGNVVPVISNSAHNYISVRDSSVRKADPDVNGYASAGNRTASVMVWNYHDKNDLSVPATPVTVSVKGIPAQKVLITHYRIDQEHSNSFTAWKRMGSPQNPTPEQYALLEKAGQLEMIGSPRWMEIKNGASLISFDLPRQGVSLIKMRW